MQELPGFVGGRDEEGRGRKMTGGGAGPTLEHGRARTNTDAGSRWLCRPNPDRLIDGPHEWLEDVQRARDSPLICEYGGAAF